MEEKRRKLQEARQRKRESATWKKTPITIVPTESPLKAEKELSPAPNPYHFGTQNPTKIDPKALKNGFENNAKYKYDFELLSVPKTLPKPTQKPPKNP